MKEWSHLPNAHHIDWVLASLKETPELWAEAWAEAWVESWDASRGAAMSAARDAVCDAARIEAWGAAMSAARDAGVARAAVQNTILVLIAYDDCDQLLSMSYERLKVWAVLSEDPRAILLLPLVYVKEKLANLNLQPA